MSNEDVIRMIHDEAPKHLPAGVTLGLVKFKQNCMFIGKSRCGSSNVFLWSIIKNERHYRTGKLDKKEIPNNKRQLRKLIKTRTIEQLL